NRMFALSPSVDTNRSAMRRDGARMENFEAVHLQQVLEAGQRVVPKMLMIDRVVLRGLEQGQQIVRFADEHSIFPEQRNDTGHDLVNFFDMCNHVGSSNDACLAIFRQDLLDRLMVEKRGQRWNATLDR